MSLSSRLKSAASSPRFRALRWIIYGGGVASLICWVAVLTTPFDQSKFEPLAVNALTIQDSRGVTLRQEVSRAGPRAQWVSLDEISPHLIHATLASEDHTFYEHRGIDWWAIGRAVWLNLTHRRSFGGSTLTMQLTRLTYRTPRTLFGKLKQMFWAAHTERHLSKRQILERYMNRVYYGNGAWGAQRAARLYFDRDAQDLSVAQSALLAVLPRGPSLYNPFKHWPRTIQRRDQILDLMLKRGYLTTAQHALAKRGPMKVKRHPQNFRAPHFVEYVKKRIPALYQRGSTIRTTLDWALQRRVEVALKRHVDGLTWRNLTQAAVVVLRNRDGAILSMVGSRDYHDREHNGAFNGTTAILRPGSTLKPFVYAAAMEDGHTPATIVYDVVLPSDINQFYTRDVRSHGFARYREALAGSYNLSAVHVLQSVGIKTLLEKLRAAGLTTLSEPDDHYDWGLAIGHAKVRLLDLTAAFSAFGRGGRSIAPRAILRMTRPDGQRTSAPMMERVPIVERPPIYSEQISYLIFDILSDPEARRPMFGGNVPLNLPFKIALKTGTTKAYTDVWALGATHEYTVGVWGGNFKGEPTRRVKSIQGATPLLRSVYSALSARFGPPTAPARPVGIISAEICPLSGRLRGPHCPHVKTELFIQGRAPTERCEWHQRVCGQESVVYPEEIRPWAAFFKSFDPPQCETSQDINDLRIVSPLEGAHFILEPHRASTLQKPLLVSQPHLSSVQWTIDGQALERWTPHSGRHVVRAQHGLLFDEVTITYE